MAQSRDNDGRLSGIKLTALSDGLRRVAVEAKRLKGVYMSPPVGGEVMSGKNVVILVIIEVFMKPLNLIVHASL